MNKLAQDKEGTIKLLTERLNEMGYKYISFDDISKKVTYKCTRCGAINTAHKNTVNKEYTDNRWKLCSYCQFTNISLYNLIDTCKNDGNTRSLISSIKKCKQYIDEVYNLTSFLEENASIEERIYCVLNDIQSLDDIMCPICKTHKLKWSKKFWLGYNNTCENKSCEAKYKSKSMLESDCNSFDKSVENFKKWQHDLIIINDNVIKTITYSSFAEYIDNPILIDYLNNRFEDSETLKESIERINLNVEKKPICANPHCNEHVKWHGSATKFHLYCSHKCSNEAKHLNIYEDASECAKQSEMAINNKETIKSWLNKIFDVVEEHDKCDFYIPKYDLFINCGNYSIVTQEQITHNGSNYLDIYNCNNEDDLRNQVSLYINCLTGIKPVTYSRYAIDKEYEYYKSLKCETDEALSSPSSQKNIIVKEYQFCEFYKKEMELYAHKPVLRRKLIENRMKYLNKKAYELTVPEIFNGFKISGLYYGYSHFNPMWTNWFINKYNIHTVYDPCGGWGHHMLGMLSCDKIIYNDFNKAVCDNIQKMKDVLSIGNLEIHNEDAQTYTPNTDVEAWFMCPPYFNVEKYNDKEFKSITDYKNFLNNIFNNWKKSSAMIFGLVIREDFVSLIETAYTKSHDLNMNVSHFQNTNGKKCKEKFYIFNKQ